MPPKRKNDDTELTARERKKIKVADARTISVQGASPKTAIQFDSMKGLPASIDVERFTEARAYEIDAMQKAIKSASGSSTHRAWQTLPRHLRRRAASHDVRRVPLRLRDKARAEMDANKRRLLGRPKRGKSNQISRAQAFLKRQRDKSWLETHIWHAKRARMQTMWGYRLAVTPTEKAFRPSHRASVHGSILHDASYYATIELKGPQSLLQTVLEQCCDPQTSGMKRCMKGGRTCETHMYKLAAYPLDLLGPVTIIWQACLAEGDPSAGVEQPSESTKEEGKEKGKKRGKGKGKDNQVDDNVLPRPDCSRVIWIRCHPCIFEEVFGSLQSSASFVLEQTKRKEPQIYAEIEIVDLRGCVNAFEIMGPRSSQVIKGALSPAGSDDRTDVKKFWDGLTDLQTSSSLPREMIVGLTVLDPRLKFPPKNAKPHYPDITEPSIQSSPPFIFPTAVIAQSEIWDEQKRGTLKKPKFKKKDLDERRSKNPVPGSPLQALRQDARIPILLIQRSIESCPPTSSGSSHSDNTQGIHGWTILFPAGWGMAFLSSLVYTGTRFAGQRERMKQSFEAGVSGFPNDYPSVAAYDVIVNELAEKDKARWERTPPAKKPNYEKLGTRSPWTPDWDVVLDLEKPIATGSKQGGGGLMTTQREIAPQHDGPQTGEFNIRPWLLRGPRTSAILSDAFITPARFLEEINRLRAKNHMTPLDETSLSAKDLMRSALLMVRMKMLRRGAPRYMANIYKMDDIEARKWIGAFGKQTQVITDGGCTGKANEHELEDIKPSSTDIIGYVTTGDTSLVRGEGFAIGAIPLLQYLALSKQAIRLSQPAVLVKIRDRDCTTCRAAYLHLLDS